MKNSVKRLSFSSFSVRSAAIATLAATGIAFGGGSAVAQTATAPAPAAQSTLTQSHIDVAREVVTLSGMARTFDGLLPTFGDQVRQTFITRPEISADLNAVLDQLKPELEEKKADILNNAARILASRLNEETLVQVRDFFRSTAGQQYVATQPLVLDDLFAALNTWIGDVSSFIVTRVREELRKRGHEL
ncbi:DUF2059 domain-containing protein [Pseudochelatococcus contaminans]|uniref:DUF2059 domain-containing protein n=1 Tax=Pseudochelatococcus contaminans TaxID=1538103 RepID=A0A7W5Z0Y4_9HYPH|nr:DUF2059 domain-containing protein [Pseudochelatococcus contaminans]MBB3807958.1 hypothetical protein [Pseudochelatococcus contaminans]